MLIVTDIDNGFEIKSDFPEEINRIKELIEWIKMDNSIPTTFQWKRRNDPPDKF